MVPQIRMHREKLEVRKGKDYAEVLFMGDLHHGHPQSWTERFTEFLDYAIQHQIYVIFMGDLLESGLTTSVGDSVYQQTLNPQAQYESVMELLKPVCEKKICLGFHMGNHEMRIKNVTGIDVAKNMCRELRIPYLGYACWNLWYVGDESYTVYSWHGSSGAKFPHSKLKVAYDAAHSFDCDVFAMAHTHDVIGDIIEQQYVDKHQKKVKVRKKLIVLTGHYLGYDASYAQMKGYAPSKLGSPRVLFNGTKHDVHVSA